MSHLKLLIRSTIALGVSPLAFVLAVALRVVGESQLIMRVFSRHGFYLLRSHYYLPIPDDDDIAAARKSELVGIDMNDELQLRLTREVISKYQTEFAAFPAAPTADRLEYNLVNGTFMAGDGDAYYSLIRHLRPRKIIEIGAGSSTLLAHHAIEANRRENPNYDCQLIVIEPFPHDYLANVASITDLKRCKLQEVPMDLFLALQANDILFIDSSHVLKSGGDVWLECCEIVPRIKSGVYLHFHDISLPNPYPTVYYDNCLYWNEQFVLQALLTNNSNLEVVWAGAYLFNKYPEEMQGVLSPGIELMRREFPLAEPSSFWLRVK